MNFKNNLFLFALAALLFSSCDLSAPSSDADWFEDGDKAVQALFTTPGYDASTGRKASAADRIAALVDSAENTVDICIYELSEPTIYESVIRAWDRGIDVRFVGDIDNMNYDGYIAMMNAGIPMSIGNQLKIMHNKYIIVDDRYVTMGSMNYTSSGAYNNNENVLFIDSPEVAAYYKKDFETMFINHLFGVDKINHKFDGFDENAFTLTNEDGTTTDLEVYVIPYIGYEGSEDGTRVDYEFMDYIEGATESIYFAVFAFTHPDIAYAMVEAARTKGVQVYGVFDKSWHTGNEYSCHQIFVDAAADCDNIHVRYDGNENFMVGNELHGQKCHNKYMVVDANDPSNAVVVTGSYNFSSAASYKGNDENFVAVHDYDLAQDFKENFFYMYSLGESPTMDQGGDEASYQDIIVNEVNWGGSADNIGTWDVMDKFIELKNTTTEDINIGGWQMVGTTAISKSYRIQMYIFPEDTIVPAGGYHILAFSTNRAFDYTATGVSVSVDKYFYLYHPDDQDYLYLRLRDPDYTLIDVVGQPGTSPFEGSYGAICTSMVRFGATSDGTDPANWIPTGSAGTAVKTSYRLGTLATPGE